MNAEKELELLKAQVQDICPSLQGKPSSALACG